MTGLLKDVMNEKTRDLGALPVDLDAIVAAGDSRLRRRRFSGIAAGAVGVAATLALASTLTHGGGSRGLDPADLGPRPFLYAVGSALHTGSGTVTAPTDVRALVSTSHGAVFTDRDRNVWAFRDGSFEQLPDVKVPAGATGRILAVDDAGNRVAFVDGYGPVLRLTVVLTDSDRLVSVPVTAADQGGEVVQPQVIAVDGSRVYFWDARGLAMYDQTTLAITVLDPQASRDRLVDVANGILLHEATPGVEGPGDLVVSADLADRSGVRLPISGGDLSPDGQHVLTQDEDQFAVFDVITGDRIDPPHPGFEFAAPYQWLDDDTIAALALATTGSGDQPISLLTCQVTTNSCTVTARDIGGYHDVAIPIGEVLDAD